MEQIPMDMTKTPLSAVVIKANTGAFSSRPTSQIATPIGSASPLDLTMERHIYQCSTYSHAHDNLRRNPSTTTYGTQWTQKTENTQKIMDRVPTEESNNSFAKGHRRRKSSLTLGNRSSTPIHFLKRAILNTADSRRRGSHHRPNDTYQELRSQPSNGGLSEATDTSSSGFQYAVTPALQEMQRPPLPKDSLAKNVDDKKCLDIPGLNYFTLIKIQLRRLFSGCPFMISIRFKQSSGTSTADSSKGRVSRPRLFEQTLRIKNNRNGSCVFQVTHSCSDKEELTPLTPLELRSYFRYNLHLVKSLEDWNSHYQNPPPHWVVNFIPKAYLRRGHRLAEEICEYFEAFPDGCRYKVEYEPIGYGHCLVGIVSTQAKKIEGVEKGGGLSDCGRIRHPSRTWETIEVGLTPS